MIVGAVLLTLMLWPAQSESCAPADAFCAELNRADALQAIWMDADHHLEKLGSFSDHCNLALLKAVRRARSAARDSFLAYAGYYRKWADSARDQSLLLAGVAAQHAALRRNIESLLAAAEREYTELAGKRDALGKNVGVSSAQELRSLNSLISISAQRVENYRKARDSWHEAEASSDAGKKAELNMGTQAVSFLRLSESERILWDAYYEGRELRPRLACHESS